MIELRTFGGLSVEVDGAPDTDGAAVQRKTLALLALLAAAGKNGLSRDKLIAYLWPETDAARGRSLLRQGCYALRRDLDADDLFLGATEMRLNPAVIESDVQAFETALASGALQSAIARYGGPFLDGFYLAEAEEFERWVEGERTRLAQRYCGALESLAQDAGERGDHRSAAEWWRRLAEADRLSTRAVIGLMTALDVTGERAAAIRQGQAHEAFIRQELGAEPASEVPALIRRLQQRSGDREPPSHEQGQATPEPVGGATEPVAQVPAPLIQRIHQARTLSLVAVGAVVLLAGGTTYALLGRQATANTTDPPALPGRKMLVVLPFENRGAPEDDYFTDGLSEAIATRLGSVQSLGIIAWPSASQYRKTNKRPEEIGRELGVQYILYGSVRWEKGPGTSRIRVSPILIRVSDAAQLWGDQYDTTLSGVFAVQTSLATRVAGALDIALGDAERRLLEARPTASLQAYDLYLRARELGDREFGPGTKRIMVDLFERAVALDSNFALAYAWLSVGYVAMYKDYVDRSAEPLVRAKAALDRALRLAPELPESHGALGFYYFSVLGNNGQALQEFEQARRLRPNDAWFPALMADIYMQQGRWSASLAYQREAVLLDPRNILIVMTMAMRFSYLRQFTQASYYYDRAVALQPQSFDARLGKALAYLSQTGDLPGSQRLLPDFSRSLDPFGYGLPILSLTDVASLLNAEQRSRLLVLTPAAVEGDTGVLALAKALVIRASDDGSAARSQFDSAAIILEAKVRQDSSDDFHTALLGLALAGLGRAADAMRQGERAVALVPLSKDAEWSGYLRANLARIYMLLNQREKVIDQLEIVLSRPGPLSAGWLRADPFWNPLRGSPRFQRLVAARN